MHSRLRGLLLFPVATLIACGGASSPPTGNAYEPVSGNYVITVGVGTASQANLTGNLLVNQPTLCNGSNVCGNFLYNGASACADNQPIPFTGTYANDVLTLTSASFSNSVATLTIKLPFSGNNLGQTVSSGTSVIAGGTCALASSTLQAQLFPTFTATWAATLTSPSSATASLVITQSATANQSGEFPTTANVTINDSGCGNPTADSTYTGLVSGGNLQLKSSQYGITITANTTGSTVSPANIIIAGDIYGSLSPSCTTVLTGTMAMQ